MSLLLACELPRSIGVIQQFVRQADQLLLLRLRFLVFERPKPSVNPSIVIKDRGVVQTHRKTALPASTTYSVSDMLVLGPLDLEVDLEVVLRCESSVILCPQARYSRIRLQTRPLKLENFDTTESITSWKGLIGYSL